MLGLVLRSDSVLARNSAFPLEQIGAAVLVHLRTSVETVRVLLAPVLHADNEQTSTEQRARESASGSLAASPKRAVRLFDSPCARMRGVLGQCPCRLSNTHAHTSESSSFHDDEHTPRRLGRKQSSRRGRLGCPLSRCGPPRSASRLRSSFARRAVLLRCLYSRACSLACTCARTRSLLALTSRHDGGG